MWGLSTRLLAQSCTYAHLCAGFLWGCLLFWIPSHYLGNDTEVVFSSSLPGFAALKLFPTLLRLQYRHKKVGYFMVFQTPKVDFTVSFATSELATTIEKRYLTHVRPNTKSNKKQSTSNPQRNFLRGGAHGTHKRNLTLYFNKTPPNLIPSSSECFYWYCSKLNLTKSVVCSVYFSGWNSMSRGYPQSSNRYRQNINKKRINYSTNTSSISTLLDSILSVNI